MSLSEERAAKAYAAANIKNRDTLFAPEYKRRCFMDLNGLKPEKVFRFFSEISKIPRGSGNTSAIAEYCMDFAQKRGLDSFRDGYGNVMIFKGGSSGYENSEPVILQGHLDMVCEKRADCAKDMERDCVDVLVDGEYIRADGTTLGGDDGIAVAYILALLDDGGISHPPIEALFTADEEIGLMGANALDASRLKGRRLINIDSEEEGVITVSCAGAVRSRCILPVSCEDVPENMSAKRLTASGFVGGHSGIDIDKGRKNAAMQLAEFLYELSGKIDLRIVSFHSGGRLNAIPRDAEAVICISPQSEGEFQDCLAAFNEQLHAVCAESEPDAGIRAENAPPQSRCADKIGSGAVISAVVLAPSGVSAISPDIPFLVQTSSNLGLVSLENGTLELGFMVRSNTEDGKAKTARRLRCLVEHFGGSIELQGNYPAWKYKKLSPLRDIMTETYRQMYGSQPEVCAIHAGLECGILSEKIAGADMASIGPNMKNVHTPDERLEIKSVQRCWDYLLRVLENLK